MTGLEGFSDWALALLPRLFLYPGGLWMLAALLVLRLFYGGPKSLRPTVLVTDALKVSLPALAWAGASLSLMPLPGASYLAAPIDRLALVALVLASLAFTGGGATDRRDGWISVCMALAVLSPLARGRSLLGDGLVWGVSGALSMLAVALGLILLLEGVVGSLSGAARWLGWVGIGFAPVWVNWTQPALPGILWASLAYTLVIGVLAAIGRLALGRIRNKAPIAVTFVGVLATLSLLSALLGY